MRTGKLNRMALICLAAAMMLAGSTEVNAQTGMKVVPGVQIDTSTDDFI